MTTPSHKVPPRPWTTKETVHFMNLSSPPALPLPLTNRMTHLGIYKMIYGDWKIRFRNNTNIPRAMLDV